MSNHRTIASRAYSTLGRIVWKFLRRKVKTSTSRKRPASRAKARRIRS